MSACLERLTPHLKLADVAITGGIGIDVGLAIQGLPATRSRVADLDVVATSVEAVRHSVAGRFLVSHYHVVRPGVPKFMVQLVDPESRIRIDIFPDLIGSIRDAQTAIVGTHRLPVLPLYRIFEHKIQTLSRASQEAPIDPKHVRDAEILGTVLQKPVPTVAPEALASDVYGLEADCNCQRCALSGDADWPLAPTNRIFELLGWTWQPDALGAVSDSSSRPPSGGLSRTS